MSASERTHWTHRLFVENARLYLPFLEQAKDHAGWEVDALAGLFAEYGAPDGGRALDLACGIGRHSVLLAGRGYRVTGVDISPLFIDKAREYAASEGVDARFVAGDALDVGSLLSEEPPFDACINMFTSHSYYGREGDVTMFSSLAELAAPGAVLVVMTANRDWIVKNFEPEGTETAGGYTIRQRRALDLETSSIMNTWEFFEGESHALTLNIDHRIYSLHEMRELLEESGWTYRAGLGAASGRETGLAPLEVDSSRMWVVAQK